MCEQPLRKFEYKVMNTVGVADYINSVGRCVIPWEFLGKSVKHTCSCRKMYPI